MKHDWKSFLHQHEKLAMIIAVSAALAGVLLSFEFSLIEANLYDLRVTQGQRSEPSPDIVLVTLDDATTKTLDEFAPLTLDYHAKFLEALERLSPKAVGYLIDMNQVSQAHPELLQSEWSQRFVDSARRLESQGSLVVLGTPFDVTGEVLPPYPLSSLSHSLAIIHKDGNVFGEDKVTRRALLELNGKPVFHLDLARKLERVSPGFLPRGSYQVPEIDGTYFFFGWRGNTAQGVSNYARVSFHDVLNNALPEGFFKDKIVLVGTLSKENSGDFATTPYSKAPFTNPKLVVHANILDSVLTNDGIVRAPEWVNIAVTFLAAVFVLWWVLNSTPLNGVFATVSAGLVFVVAAQILFQHAGIWIREAQPLIAIFVAYYLAVPYRLIREYKKRWEYQRKNELLTQVEELKTNFLNLVTHDLKTPIARIQGLAEVLMRKAGERLIDRDKETIHHIISATDELNLFISRILELSRVESEKLQLRLESKDVNQIIERCLESFKAPARAKQIELVSTLEPLFPVRLDAGLISKVFNNLVDNAIKYSPQGSTVTVESREITADDASWIEIAVKDQGIGLSDAERENLFTRFYRAKNDTTAKTAGTGLGLYLTRYFVHAHGGRVEVESSTGQGSTFKIVLPIEQPAKPGLLVANVLSFGIAFRK